MGNNGTMAAIAAGVLSFGAALGGAFLLIESQDAPKPTDTSALESRLDYLESAEAAAKKVKPVKAKVEKFDSSGLESKIKKQDKTIETLQGEIATLKIDLSKASKMAKSADPALATEGAVPAADSGDVLKVVEANLSEMMQRVRDNEREEKRLATIASFKTSAPDTLSERLMSKLEEYGISEGQVSLVKASYASRLDSVLAVSEEIRLAKQAGEEISSEEVSKRFADAVAPFDQAIKDTVGDTAFEKIQGEVARADMSGMRRGGGSALGRTEARAANQEASKAWEKAREERRRTMRGGNNGGNRNNNNGGRRNR